MLRIWGSAARMAVFVGVAGCWGDQPAGPDGIDLASIVTPEVARQIADGRFTLGEPVDVLPVLSEASARQLAQVLGRQFGALIRYDLEAQHEGPIDFARLRACGRSYFARSPFDSIPTDRSDLRFYFGAFWIVGLCDDDRTTISVAVAANATDLRIENGWVHPEPNSLKIVGVPPAWNGALPVDPEHAAKFVTDLTSRRVAAVPVLYAPNPLDAFPQGAIWAIELDDDVVVRGITSSQTVTTPHVLVSSINVSANAMLRGGVALFLEHPDARRSLEIPDGWADSPGFVLQVRRQAVLDIEPATIVRSGSSQP